MILDLWNSYLYQPVFNLLIWIYSNWSEQNLGWAVIYLTILLRVALLPMAVISFRNRRNDEALERDIHRLEKEFHNDEVMKKQEIRRALKKYKVSPWAKIASLGVQGLVLVLLYQVFLNGITGQKVLSTLYHFIEFPGKINSMFHGFDLGQKHDIWWSGAVAILLFAENYIVARRKHKKFTKGDLSYFVAFPLAVFFLLWILPMVKSLFVLTSMVFSIIIDFILSLFFKAKDTVLPETKKGHT